MGCRGLHGVQDFGILLGLGGLGEGQGVFEVAVCRVREGGVLGLWRFIWEFS